MKTVTRDDLYEQVWSRPMIAVAADYGVTSTALKKTCNRHKIPTPERGYWAKLQNGKSVRKQPLPKLTDKRLEKIRISGNSTRPVSEEVRQAGIKARERLSASIPRSDDPATNAPVKVEYPIEPKVLAATRRAISKARPSEAGYCSANGPGIATLSIAPSSMERALSILSCLFGLLECQGHSVRPLDTGLVLVIDDEPVAFGIEEKPQQVLHVPTQAELKRSEECAKWGYSQPSWPKYDHLPSGRLAFVIHANPYGGLRRTYADRKTRLLEDLLPDVMVALAEHVALIKERRRADEARAREWKKAETRRARAATFDAMEKRRTEFVDAIHEQLSQRAKLSAVLSHLESAEDARGVKAMISWVRRRLQEIDAIVSPQFLDLSARLVKLDFEDVPPDPTTASASGYYGRAVQLHLWSIDEEKDEATSMTVLEWLTKNGLMPEPEATGQPDA